MAWEEEEPVDKTLNSYQLIAMHNKVEGQVSLEPSLGSVIWQLCDLGHVNLACLRQPN